MGKSWEPNRVEVRSVGNCEEKRLFLAKITFISTFRCMFAKITFLPAFCGMFTKITFIPKHARQNHVYSHLLPSQMSSYRGFRRSITIKNLPFLESPFRVRNIATSQWLATSTARMKMANMRANLDLGNTRGFVKSPPPPVVWWGVVGCGVGAGLVLVYA